jgi:pectinesterase
MPHRHKLGENLESFMRRFSRRSSFIILSVAALLCQPLHAEKILRIATDGSAPFHTPQQALAQLDADEKESVVLELAAGVYQGPLVIAARKQPLRMIGESAESTIITWDRNVNDPRPDGADHFNPGVKILCNDFSATNITFRNTSGDHGQALALRSDADRVRFRNCRFEGWQDTLMVNKGRHDFVDCFIEGRVDFIYGDATAFFDRCHIHSKNGGYITAASTPQQQPYGFVFKNCKLTGDSIPWKNPDVSQQSKSRSFPNTYFGRPWRPNASVGFLFCQTGPHILPEGWHNWNKPDSEKTARYYEYRSPSQAKHNVNRVAWSKQIPLDEALAITPRKVLAGTDDWNPRADLTTIVLVGDSTVCDYPENDHCRGWGQFLPAALNNNCRVINTARKGRSTKTFIEQHLWHEALALHPDVVMIQFGHNDSHPADQPESTNPTTDFPQHLRRLIDDCRAHQAQPILVTPVARRTFRDGKLSDSLRPYAEAMHLVGKEKNVPVIDLHRSSSQLLLQLGEEKSKSHANAPDDHTHFNEAGARAMLKLLLQDLPKVHPASAAWMK